MEIVNQNLKKIQWKAFVFNVPQNRVFNCNAVIFKNAGIYANVIINDIYELEPGEQIYLRSNLNEVDVTPYKIDFTSIDVGFKFKLKVWIKQDSEIETLIPKDQDISTQVFLDRRTELEDIQRDRERK